MTELMVLKGSGIGLCEHALLLDLHVSPVFNNPKLQYF